MSEPIICSICGNEIPEEECTTFHDQALCPGCLHTHIGIFHFWEACSSR